MKLTEIFGHQELSYDRTKPTRWPDYFGIELEVENCNNPEGFGQWITHADGSLRNGIEFVLDGPIGGANLEKSIAEFYNRGLRYTAGPRTSTHIHINARDLDLDQLRTMMIVMHIVEDQLFNTVGESRKWAGYATGLVEMDGKRLRTILTSNDHFQLMNAISPGRNQERYYGFNVASAKRHGTVEFRHFPGGPSIGEMKSWLDFVWSVKNLAMNISLDKILALNSPDELVGLLAAFFTKEWQDNILVREDKESLYRKFCEIGALCGEPDMERRERIVFLTKPLTDFINKTLLGEAGHEAFAKVLKNFTVLGMGDFQNYLDDAMSKDNLSNRKKKVNLEPDVAQQAGPGGRRGRPLEWAQVGGDVYRRLQDVPPAPVPDVAPDPFERAADQGWGPPEPQPVHVDEVHRQAQELRYEEVRRRAERMYGRRDNARAAPAAPLEAVQPVRRPGQRLADVIRNAENQAAQRARPNPYQQNPFVGFDEEL